MIFSATALEKKQKKGKQQATAFHIHNPGQGKPRPPSSSHISLAKMNSTLAKSHRHQVHLPSTGNWCGVHSRAQQGPSIFPFNIRIRSTIPSSFSSASSFCLTFSFTCLSHFVWPGPDHFNCTLLIGTYYIQRTTKQREMLFGKW